MAPPTPQMISVAARRAQFETSPTGRGIRRHRNRRIGVPEERSPLGSIDNNKLVSEKPLPNKKYVDQVTLLDGEAALFDNLRTTPVATKTPPETSNNANVWLMEGSGDLDKENTQEESSSNESSLGKTPPTSNKTTGTIESSPDDNATLFKTTPNAEVVSVCNNTSLEREQRKLLVDGELPPTTPGRTRQESRENLKRKSAIVDSQLESGNSSPLLARQIAKGFEGTTGKDETPPVDKVKNVEEPSVHTELSQLHVRLKILEKENASLRVSSLKAAKMMLETELESAKLEAFNAKDANNEKIAILIQQCAVSAAEQSADTISHALQKHHAALVAAIEAMESRKMVQEEAPVRESKSTMTEVCQNQKEHEGSCSVEHEAQPHAVIFEQKEREMLKRKNLKSYLCCLFPWTSSENQEM